MKARRCSSGFPSLFFGAVVFVVNRSFLRQDAHKKYEHGMDVLYALGDPQPVKTTEL